MPTPGWLPGTSLRPDDEVEASSQTPNPSSRRSVTNDSGVNLTSGFLCWVTANVESGLNMSVSQVRATSSANVGEYVGSVAATVDALSVDWWCTPAFDAVVTLSSEIPYYRGRKAVLAWNRTFGWSLGVHGLTPGNVLVVEGLGLGPAPDPARCSDRVAELIAELADWAPQRSGDRPSPRIVHGPHAPTG